MDEVYNPEGPTTQEFFSDCVRLNRPCVLRLLAKTWPAYQKWPDLNGGREYLSEKLKGWTFKVFGTEALNSNLVENKRYHFNANYTKSKSYEDFLTDHETKPDFTAFQDSVLHMLKDDVVVPEFMVSATALKGLDMTQGVNFVDKPRYIADEQLLCAIEGNLSVALAAHVYRQELWAGRGVNPVYNEYFNDA